MTISAIKKELHRYIDTADEEQLKAMYQLLEFSNNSNRYAQEELDKFYGILEDYKNGDLKTVAIETAHDSIRERLSRQH